MLMFRAFSIANLIRGAQLMNVSQLVRGYSDSVFGIPRKTIPDVLINAHMDKEYLRDIERKFKEKVTQTVINEMMYPGIRIVVYHPGSMKNCPNQWIEATGL